MTPITRPSDTSPLKRCLLLGFLALVVAHFAYNWRMFLLIRLRKMYEDGDISCAWPDSFGIPRDYSRGGKSSRSPIIFAKSSYPGGATQFHLLTFRGYSRR